LTAALTRIYQLFNTEQKAAQERARTSKTTRKRANEQFNPKGITLTRFDCAVGHTLLAAVPFEHYLAIATQAAREWPTQST
jgi:hypothetical protein